MYSIGVRPVNQIVAFADYYNVIDLVGLRLNGRECYG